MTVVPCLHNAGLSFDDDGWPVCSECRTPMSIVPTLGLMNMAEVRMKVRALVMAEETSLRDRSLSWSERACRKAARDAYRLVIDIMDESGRDEGRSDRGHAG